MKQIAENIHVRRRLRRSSCRFRRPSGAMDRSRLRHLQQPPSNYVQIRQHARVEHSMSVLVEPFVPCLQKTEAPFDDHVRVLDLGPHLRFRLARCPLDIVDYALAPVAAIGHVLRIRGATLNALGLALVGRIAPDFSLLAMEEVGRADGVMDVGPGQGDGADSFRTAVDADVGFYIRELLVVLPGLVCVRTSALLFVLGQRWCTDNGRVDNGASADLDTVGVGVVDDVLEGGFADAAPLEQMTKARNVCFVWSALLAETATDEAAHQRRIVESTFGSGVGQIELLIEKVGAEHQRHLARRTVITGDSVDRRNQSARLTSGEDTVRIVVELRAPSRLHVLLEAVAQRQWLLNQSISLAFLNFEWIKPRESRGIGSRLS